MGRYSYTNALGVLTEWAINEGFTDIDLNYNDISQIGWHKDTLNIPYDIKIEGKYPIELKVYLFLHELGHHQLRKNWDEFEVVLPVIAHAEGVRDKRYKRRLIYSVSCMEEEFKAWDEGYKLGIDLGIRINIDKWLELKGRCLMTYMRYYVMKK